MPLLPGQGRVDAPGPRRYREASSERAELELIVPRLTKRDVESLLGSYDADPVAALVTALLRVEAPTALRAAVATMDTVERDRLLKDLVEWRGITPPDPD